MTTASTNPFFATRSQVLDLARRRYFEEGVLPAGVVSDAVFQSWARCQRLHGHPEHKVEFQPVTHSRAQLALQRNRPLFEAWQAELPALQALLGTTSSAAMLTDGTGVLIGATCTGRPHEHLMPVVTRLGVNLSEEAVGTTAPGIVVRTGQAVSVLGSEHFFDRIRQMHCAAAPIRDAQVRLAGVLDLSSESLAFGFDAGAVVGHLASAIENRLLLAQAADSLVLRIQVSAPLLDSSAVGLLGIRADGRVAWLNGVAARLLGSGHFDGVEVLPTAEAVLGHTFQRLARLPRHGASALALGNGLSLWARAELRDEDGRQDRVHVPAGRPPAAAAARSLPLRADPAPAQPATPTPRAAPLPTVKATQDELLQDALNAVGGNVSQAARRLGVSRGWIYRRMLDSAART